MTPGDRLGATVVGDGTRFVVWAPGAGTMHLDLPGRDLVPLAPAAEGCWAAEVDGVRHGDRYGYSIDGDPPLPDPASAWQPDGVHGASAVVDPARFAWTDDGWRGRGLEGAVVYELHVGAFTPGGTFDDAIGELPRLAELGVTTLELMPVHAFPGERNWGYDVAFPWAVQQSYGGPDGLARLVDAAHAAGLAVILDVVFNHFGPEGARQPRFGPYLSDSHRLPWGPAINVAGPGSDGVRRYYLESVERWIRDFHVDGFRLDAVHAIVDPTANPFWGQVCDTARAAARAAGRRIVLIAESSDNDPRQLHAADRNGIGFDAVWCDDVHHTLRVATTGDRSGYYADYEGTASELADTVRHRWHFRGQHSIARGRRHGRPVDEIAPNRFVACTQNHDQVGNRPAGERPDHHVSPAQRRLAPAALLLSPYTPMLFMGEEYGERRPFPFFVDHTDPEVLRATNEGRRAEFAGADWSVEVPEPGARSTFDAAVLDPSPSARDDTASRLLSMYTELLRLRREVAAVASPAAVQRVEAVGGAVAIHRALDEASSTTVINMSGEAVHVSVPGRIAFASDDGRWGGDGATRVDDDGVTVAPWTVALVVA